MSEEALASGRILPVIPSSGYGEYADIRTGIVVIPGQVPFSDDEQEPLVAYISDGKVMVTPGFVGDVVPTIGGVALDDEEPPQLTPSTGDNWLHMKGTYEPAVYQLGVGFAAIGSSGTVSNVTFSLTQSASASPAETYPKISGGAALNGSFDIVWAKINKDGDNVTIVIPSRGGDAHLVFMPPNLYVAFRGIKSSAP